MKTWSVVFFAGAALALAACEPSAEVDASPAAEAPAAAPVALAEAPAAPEVAPMDEAAGPSGADAQTWIADRNGEDGIPRLRYADPATGETVFKIECIVNGALYLSISRPIPETGQPESWPFKVIAGDLPSGTTGEVRVTSISGFDSVGAYPITDGVMSRFRRNGMMSLSDAVLADPLPINAVDAEEMKAVDFFFDACEGN